MAYCFYNSKLIRPVSTVDITKNYGKNAKGNFGKVYNITMNLTLIAYAGSPQSSGFWTLDTEPPNENIAVDARFEALSRKEEFIRDLFATDGQVLEFQPANGGLEVKCNPRLTSINSVAGPKVDTLNMVLQFEADLIEPDEANDSFEAFISDAQENWSLETDENPENINTPRTYRLSHSISAVGARHYLANGDLEQEAWEQARDYVLPRLGIDNTILSSSGVNNLPAYYGGFNHLRAENIDENTGSYSVTETWVISSGAYFEDFNLNTQLSQDGMRHVTVDGNIVGLEERDSNMLLTTSKWDNAVTGYNSVEALAHTRAETYSTLSLNSVPLNKTIGRNPTGGTISYSYEYDDRPSAFITNTVSERISIQNSYQVDLFAEIPVLGRTTGPVLQDLNSKQAATRSVDISLVMGPDYMPSGLTVAAIYNDYNPRLHSPQSTEIDDILTAVKPIGNALNNLNVDASTEFIGNRSETWDASSRSYNLSVSWTFE